MTGKEAYKPVKPTVRLAEKLERQRKIELLAVRVLMEQAPNGR